MPEARRTFGPVVSAGLVAAGLSALAGTRAWVEADTGARSGIDALGMADAGEMPLAGALGFVLLACWGVVLVTRRRARRAVAVVGLLASLGLLVTVTVGWTALPDQLVDSLAAQTGERPDVATVRRTGWYWVAAAAAVGSVAATAQAVRWTPHWPVMGSRYDAPRAVGEPSASDEGGDQTPLDLWRAMDEGRDPTA